jgi:hypothetical protein
MVLALAALAAAALLLLAPAKADDTDAIIHDLPRAFAGTFLWRGDQRPQTVEIRIERVARSGPGQVEALGCGRYEAAGSVTVIAVRMLIDVADLRVEIWERVPESDAPGFMTDGSHRGRLTDKLRTIDAEWTTRATGATGRLQLHATSEANCVPGRAASQERPQ